MSTLFKNESILSEAEKAGREFQVVVFQSGGSTFAVDIANVNSIIMPQATTAPAPRAPSYVAGVITLRGKIVPILDLRARFGFGPDEATATQRIIVVDAAGVTAGFLVDAVSEVASLSASRMTPPTGLTAMVELECVRGIAGTDGNRSLIVLDAEKTITSSAAEIEALRDLQSGRLQACSRQLANSRRAA